MVGQNMINTNYGLTLILDRILNKSNHSEKVFLVELFSTVIFILIIFRFFFGLLNFIERNFVEEEVITIEDGDEYMHVPGIFEIIQVENNFLF